MGVAERSVGRQARKETVGTLCTINIGVSRMRQKIEAPKFMASRLLRAARAEPFDKLREGSVVNYGYFINRRAGLAALALASVVSLFGTIQAANAAVGSASFNVTATLASACTVGPIGDLAFGTVTAFVAPPNATTTAVISCTRTLASVTAVFDTANGTSSAAGVTPTGAGVLDNGLQYTLSTAKGAVTSGTAATSASIGTADTFTYTITGIMAAQAGTCSSGTCVATPQARTLTLNF